MADGLGSNPKEPGGARGKLEVLSLRACGDRQVLQSWGVQDYRNVGCLPSTATANHIEGQARQAQTERVSRELLGEPKQTVRKAKGDECSVSGQEELVGKVQQRQGVQQTLGGKKNTLCVLCAFYNKCGPTYYMFFKNHTFKIMDTQ